MPNRLAAETSPYLLQHADNPVDWYPWGEEALALSKATDKPILLSIGYAACHWCHVMAHESFEDPETAELMNQYYVNVKVDREERPDLDHIYMSAVQAMTGQGGWPMTMFLTPDGHPIYGGTYFPPTPRYGMPSFRNILLAIADAWATKREGLLENSQKLVDHISRDYALSSDDTQLPDTLIPTAVSQATTSFDKIEGGFGSAPKFPPSMLIEALLRVATVETQNLASLHNPKNPEALEGRSLATPPNPEPAEGRSNATPSAFHMAEHTLQKMAHGGMYDQIGGGFARYSVDNEWLAPHFEKMLYDNGQLARVYLHAYQLTRNPLYRRITEETLDWTLKEMTHADGGFYSSLDADSEGEEGKFYVWQKAEIVEILQEAAPLFMAYYDVTDNGNWEHKNILRALKPLAEVAQHFGLSETDAVVSIEESKSALYAVRAERIWPGLDDKILTSWNGLMLGAMAEAGAILGRSDYLIAACKNAEFLYDNLRTPEGRLLRTWKAGSKAKYNAYLEDYAYLADGLLALYQATYDDRWFVWAQELAEMMLAHFHDAQAGGFYDTSDDHETLIHRPKTLEDNAVPSPNAMAARVLLTLGLLTGDGNYTDIAQSMTAALAPAMMQYPTGFGHWLGNAWLLQNSPKEVAIIGDVETASSLIAVLRDGFRPNLVSAIGFGDTIPLLRGREQLDNQPTAYVCQNFVCNLPTTEPDSLKKEIGG